MRLKTKGIVLHTVKYAETSVIVKIYTEKLGLVSYIVKGVRTSKSKNKAALLQPTTLLEMEVDHRENKQLQFIKEFHRAYNYQSTPFNTVKSTVALLLIEVISKSIREHEPNEEMFDFVYQGFCMLDEMNELNPDFHLMFLMHFTRHLGFMPHAGFSEQTPCFELNEGTFIPETQERVLVLSKSDSRVIAALINSSFAQNRKMNISRAERKKALQNLVKYYSYHIENFNLKSTEILEEVLS